MAYEKAIRLLAHLECPQPPGMSDVKYLSLVDDVCRSKFTYVVASQARVEGWSGGAALQEGQAAAKQAPQMAARARASAIKGTCAVTGAQVARQCVCSG